MARKPRCCICGRWLTTCSPPDVKSIEFRKTDDDLRAIEEHRRFREANPDWIPMPSGYAGPSGWYANFCLEHQDIADFAHLPLWEAMEAYKARERSRLRMQRLRVALLLIGIIAIVGGLLLWFLS